MGLAGQYLCNGEEFPEARDFSHERFTLERNVNVYECIRSTCKKEYITIRALSDNGKYHVCNKCGADIAYLGKRKMIV